MSLMQRVRGFFRGAPPARRVVVRPVVRRLKSADVSRLTDDWRTHPQPIDHFVARNQRIVRARSREAYFDSDYARKFINLCVINVVGPRGVTLQVKTRNPSGKLDVLANDSIEEAWREWAQDPMSCDLENELTFHEIESLAVRTSAIDGECFIREVSGPEAGPWGYSLLSIDPELIPVTMSVDLRGGRRVRQGIEYDQIGRRAAYYVRTAAASDLDYLGQPMERVPAERMIHCFVKEAVGQKRGMPWATSGLYTIKMVDGYDEAAIVNARAGASKMGFYTSEEGAEYEGDDLVDDGEPEGDLISDFEAGVMEKLPPGIKFEGWDPTYPHGQYEAFHDANVRRLAAGLGVSFHSLSQNLKDVNFSSIRQGSLEERDMWRVLQRWLIARLHRRVYSNWIRVQVVRGSILVAGRPLNGALTAKYQRSTWQPRSWDWVDPMKDVSAKQAEVDGAMRSISSVIREKGDDPDDVFREIQEERQKLADMGIDIAAAVKSAVPSVQPGEEAE